MSIKEQLKEYGVDEVLKAIGLIKSSNFLKGGNARGWIITFDWFLKPSNFVKVLEGNYSDKADYKSKLTNKQNLQGVYKSVDNKDLEAMLENKRKNKEV